MLRARGQVFVRIVLSPHTLRQPVRLLAPSARAAQLHLKAQVHVRVAVLATINFQDLVYASLVIQELTRPQELLTVLIARPAHFRQIMARQAAPAVQLVLTLQTVQVFVLLVRRASSNQIPARHIASVVHLVHILHQVAHPSLQAAQTVRQATFQATQVR